MQERKIHTLKFKETYGKQIRAAETEKRHTHFKFIIDQIMIDNEAKLDRIL